jgi:PAS domain-containing protein
MSNRKKQVKRALQRRAREFAPVYSDQNVLDRVAGAPLDAVRRLAAEHRQAEFRLRAAVTDARAARISWDPIGRATGLNAEAARYRWGRVK